MVCQLPLAVRQERQVIAHDIDRYRRQHKNQADPEPPVTMRTLPVGRTRVVMNTVVLRPFVPMATVVTFIHWFCAFSIPSPVILEYCHSIREPWAGRCLCYAPGFVSCGILVDLVSIAALYSPRRAARLHLAR